MTIATSPATAQINCLERNAYGDPKRSRAITAEAEKTITKPRKTSSMVTVKSQRSTLTRFAMGHLFHHGGRQSARRLLSFDCCLFWYAMHLSWSSRYTLTDESPLTTSLNTFPRCS